MTTPPPGAMGLPYLGKALAFLANPFAFTLDGTRRYGTVWKTRILGDTMVFFAGPKAFAFFMDEANFTRDNGSPRFMQEILHRDAVPFLDGERHKTRKRLLLSAFTDDAIDSYLPGVFAIIERFVRRWVDAGERALAADLAQLGYDIADRLFAAADGTASNEQGAADFAIMNRGVFSPPIKLPFTAYGRALKARDRMRAYIKRAAARDGRGTALGILKQARGPNGEALPQDELEIELLHFFFAAHGGLTASIAWQLVVLGQHPELAARVRAEADAILGDGPPTLATAKQLVLARAVAREVLRAYPIAPTTFIGVAKKQLELDGYTIEAGWKGAGAIWATLQDGTTFTDPTAFDAARLADDKLAALPASAFVPMSGGPPDGHRCAGEQLVKNVMPAFLGWFARRYDVALPQQDLSPGAGGFAPLPRGGLVATITPRR